MQLTRVVAAVLLQVIEGRDQMDWKRHGVFVTFGFFYLVSTTVTSSSLAAASNKCPTPVHPHHPVA